MYTNTSTRRIAACLAGVGTAGAITLATVPAQAVVATTAHSVMATSSWQADPKHGEPPEYKCTINASARARLAWLKNPGEPKHYGLLLTTSADVHNPYVFVGCTIRVHVDVLDSDGAILATVSHDAPAYAWLDPRGNNKSYTWPGEVEDLDAGELPEVDGLEIRLENVD